MHYILRGLGLFFNIILLTGLHIGLSYILPYPWSKINILFTVLIILLLWWNSGIIVWLTFFSHLFLELYVTTPYGVVLFAATISILLGYWLYQNFFTNHSWYTAVALTAFTLFLYRILYTLLIVILKLFNVVAFVPWQQIFITFFWEFIFTTIAVAILYFILSRFSKRLNVTLIKSSIFHYEKRG